MDNFVEEQEETMPQTELHGYIFMLDAGGIDPTGELSEESIEKRREFLKAEVNKCLPEYATWYESTSSIIVPVNKVDEFVENIDWESVKEEVYNNYLTADGKGVFD